MRLVVKHRNLPVEGFPLFKMVTNAIALDYYHAPLWMFYVCGGIWLIYIAYLIASKLTERGIDIFDPDSDPFEC